MADYVIKSRSNSISCILEYPNKIIPFFTTACYICRETYRLLKNSTKTESCTRSLVLLIAFDQTLSIIKSLSVIKKSYRRYAI